MKYYIELDNLEERCNEIMRYSKNDISEKINILDELKNQFEWVGRAHDSFIASYDKEIEKLRNLNNHLSSLGEFLLFFQNNYNDTQGKLASMMNEYLDELNTRKR